jgi:hypothetical protein
MSSWANQIEEDLGWREAELASLKLAAAAAPQGSDRQRALLRALWTMLYAHYEGFFKFCWDLFLSEVEKTGCRRRDAAHCIALLSLSKVFQTFRGETSADQIWSFVHNTLPAEMELPVVFSSRLDTRSNLWPNLAQENNASVGISTTQIEAHAAQLSALVGRRNEIAHGKKLVVDSLDEYSIYEKAVMIVLHEIAVKVVEQLENRTFMVAPVAALN